MLYCYAVKCICKFPVSLNSIHSVSLLVRILLSNLFKCIFNKDKNSAISCSRRGYCICELILHEVILNQIPILVFNEEKNTVNNVIFYS